MLLIEADCKQKPIMKIYLTGFANWNPRLRSHFILGGIPAAHSTSTERPYRLTNLIESGAHRRVFNIPQQFCFPLPISLIQIRHREQNRSKDNERDYSIKLFKR